MQRELANSFCPVRPLWDRELAAKGFTRKAGNGHAAFDGVAFSIDGNWPVLRTEACFEEADPLAGEVGKPGLWKVIKGDRGLYRMFDLPPSVLTGVEGDDWEDEATGSSRFGSVLTWALDTVKGDPPEGWDPPPLEDVEALIPPGWLTQRSGAHARQGELLHEPGCLALRFPIVQHVSESLPEHRLYWLRRLLLDAQAHWRLVRLGSEGDLHGSTVYAEVNLTGAPHAVISGMICLAVAALHAVLEWTVGPAVFLLDTRNEAQALEVFGTPPLKKIPQEKGGETHDGESRNFDDPLIPRV